jgi:tetratricopeptide (TPR) repeat protein
VDNTQQLAPLCFVLMPFGTKTDAAGRVTNFDKVYHNIIAPAVVQAGLEPVRADEEKIGGTIHKPMFERLMLCHYAVADITGANPNVFYELGIRHALRPRSTAIIFVEGTVIPFDIALVRGIAYRTDGKGEPIDIEAPIAAIRALLREARDTGRDDSPMFQLIDDLPRWEIDHTKTDVFRQSVDYSKKYKDRLNAAVREGAEAVQKIANEPGLASLVDVEAGIVVDLFLSLRDVKAYDGMIALYDRMPAPLQQAKMMREQLGFALNRVGRFDDAEKILKGVIEQFGPSSETNGLLGRIYKDRWEIAREAKRPEARSLLRRAIDTYLEGFQADWRDAYPGVNAVSLMELQDKRDERQAGLLPVVRYSAVRKAEKNPDYWDHATLMELAVLGRDEEAAEDHLSEALSFARASWELESTAASLVRMRRARSERGEDVALIERLEQELIRAAKEMAPEQKTS